MTPTLGKRVRLGMLVALTSISTYSCAIFRGAPEARSLAVDLPVSRSEAVRRTLAAFREQGYVIRSTLSSGLNPETEPFRQGDAEAVFRAAITGSQTSARVVLSGTYRVKQFGGIVRTDEKEVRDGGDATERALWSRLEQIRLTIRQP